ncbi:TRAF-like superfamily protein [Rhynchospora pubera]|uniref:TRAF-like superfamily protein n=1 Tax=Rhynchospora pubera TaxID=906938 RepID=A0AAV8F9S3_9POAL|nr:TRAF-like superfamily protein [Rhynchospora pubera]KAJ4782847.1 TRAF-like superfamily protein [Rhynchospora pubera]KAJ4789749.1 TRAF-like superfamily protein [Rhynchospora pubera]
MAGLLTEDTDLDAISTDQRCQSGESLAEWSRSSEQVENGTPSTSPPYYETDDDDCGPKPSELFGRFTWRIESFSQINKRELRSNSFDVGGYKWYILIYPQGCDVFNHLSLFLCVANHDKLLPGWSHFAQFTIAVVNKDPKKSKYSDTLHRFWKKEHDWGWKKFMELSKLNEGFLGDDVLIIKAQVQVIREKADRPFRCLDCHYRRELVRVYITNIDQICRRFIDDRRMKLSRLVDDKVRWSSFRAFWLSIDPATKRRMSREKTDTILKVLVKHFFVEKEVTSTLVMDSMYSGLKSLEYQSMNKKSFLSNGDEAWAPYPMVYIDQDTFVLADDVVALIEGAVSDTWPQQIAPAKDDRGSQNRTKEGNSGDDCSSVHHYDRDDRRLTELGRRTVEFFALIQIFSRVEVAHQEAVALRRQEELIREEEAAGLAENGKREKDKRSKKKQSKQKKSGRKGKDKGKNKDKIMVIDDTSSKQEEIAVAEAENEATSDASEIIDDASEALQLDADDRDSSPVNWETDTSETRQIGASSSEMVNGDKNGKRSTSIDDSSSTCSTDSASAPFKVQASPNRGRKQLNKNKNSLESAKNGLSNMETDSFPESSTSVSLKPEQVTANSTRDGVLPNTQQMPDKKEEMGISNAMLKFEEKTETKAPAKMKTMEPSPVSCPVPLKRPLPVLSPQKPTPETVPRATPSNAARTEPVAVPSQSPSPKPTVTQSKSGGMSSPDATVSRPLSAPLIPAARNNVSVPPAASNLQNAPVLSRSASSLGKLTNAAASAPKSYLNAMMGTNDTFSASTSTNTSTVGTSKPVSSDSPSSATVTVTPERSIFNFTPVKPDESQKPTSVFTSRIEREFERWRTSRPSSDPPLTSISGSASDEFPHLDIINDLLDEDMSDGVSVSEILESQPRIRSFTRQYSMPNHPYSNGYVNGSFGTIGSGFAGSRVAGTGANSSIGSTRHFSHVDLVTYSNGYVDDMPDQWHGHGDISVVEMGDTNGYPYLLGEYSGMMGGVNGYHPMYHPSNGY